MATDASTRLVVLPPVPANCFRDPERECTASCMAFQNPPEDQKHQRWSFCKILSDSDRSVRHLRSISNSMETLRGYLDDDRRANQSPPPRPR